MDRVLMWVPFAITVGGGVWLVATGLDVGVVFAGWVWLFLLCATWQLARGKIY